jgi:osmoprotectant transport system permease protein
MRPGRAVIAAATVLAALLLARSAAARGLHVGSKRFTESYVLAEIVADLARAEGATDVTHDQGLGATAVVFRALEDGAIDVYPEYTGTLAEAIVGNGSAELPALRAALAPRGLAVSDPIGFENTYALAVARATSSRLSLRTISDLAEHPGLRFGLSHELVGRTDGWPGLSARYGLRPSSLSSLDHGLAYEAVKNGTVDVTDVYTTDAKIPRYDLVVLDDDRRFFPPYQAVLVHRADLAARVPAFARVLRRMRGAIDAPTMQRLNARAELDGVPFATVAADFVASAGSSPSPRRAAARPSFVSGLVASIVQYGPRHLALVAGALVLATLAGVPLGILAYARPRVGAAVLGVTGIVQTIPSLALFCFFIPLLGIGALPALAALFLYGLLPIVRNTHAGLASIPSDLREAAAALGLSRAEQLRHVELPLASRTIIAGIKTSAVIAVGAATIAAFIGAGGFGEPISTGLSLNDVPTILQGAIPAALLAILVQGAFALVERAVVPRALRA